VNSGRYAARREQELNSLKTNLESARETARQLRLRDIGGIIIIDFIDMVDERNKKKVYDEMKKEMRKDRAKSSILPLTEFGLMQITRQRIRQSISDTLSDECPACGGTGMLISETTVIHQIERWMDNYRKESDRSPVTLRVHPMLRDKLTSGFLFSPFRKMKARYKVRATIETDHGLRADEFRFISPKGDITPDYLAQRQSAEVLEEQSAPAPTPRSSGPRREGRGEGRGEGREGRPQGQTRRPHRRRPQRPNGRRERPAVAEKQRERTQ
jgi:ribonuclease G